MFKKFKVGDLVNYRPDGGKFDLVTWVVKSATLYPGDIYVMYDIERVSDGTKVTLLLDYDLRFARNPNPIEG